MNTIRKSIVLTIVMAVMVAPVAAFAQEDTRDTTTTLATDERIHRPLDGFEGPCPADDRSPTRCPRSTALGDRRQRTHHRWSRCATAR